MVRTPVSQQNKWEFLLQSHRKKGVKMGWQQKEASVCPSRQQELKEQYSKGMCQLQSLHWRCLQVLWKLWNYHQYEAYELFQIKRQYCPVKDNKHVLLYMKEKLKSLIQIARNEDRPKEVLFRKQPREMGAHSINETPAEWEMAYLVFSAAQDRKKSGGKISEDNRRDCYLFRKMKGIMEIKSPLSWEEGGIGAMCKPQRSSWFRKQAKSLYEFFPDNSINPKKKVGFYLIW